TSLPSGVVRESRKSIRHPPRQASLNAATRHDPRKLWLPAICRCRRGRKLSPPRQGWVAQTAPTNPRNRQRQLRSAALAGRKIVFEVKWSPGHVGFIQLLHFDRNLGEIQSPSFHRTVVLA